jgi:hypothetical protein
MATSNEQKIAATTHVMTYEAIRFADPAQTAATKANVYQGMVSMLTSLEPWADEGPLWAYMTGAGYWDTWRNLRTRLDAASPWLADRVKKAEPESVAAAAVEGFAEGAKEGAQELATAAEKVATVASETVKNADKLLIGLLVLVGFVVVSRIWKLKGA